jgi:hypothetical protein
MLTSRTHLFAQVILLVEDDDDDKDNNEYKANN